MKRNPYKLSLNYPPVTQNWWDKDEEKSMDELISETLREDKEYERMEQREIEKSMEREIDDLGFPI